MANWVPFVFLSLFSILLLSLSLDEKSSRFRPEFILFWLFISGLAYVFEYVIFVLFNSYTYHPHIFRIITMTVFWDRSVHKHFRFRLP